jgi:hypothetical protein
MGNDRKGDEERFPPRRLPAGCRFRKETIAGMRRNGQNAPIPDLPALAPERRGGLRRVGAERGYAAFRRWPAARRDGFRWLAGNIML